MFCVSAEKDMGVRRMMEFLGNVVPFVEDMPAPVDTEGEKVHARGYWTGTTFEPNMSRIWSITFS